MRVTKAFGTTSLDATLVVEDAQRQTATTKTTVELAY